MSEDPCLYEAGCDGGNPGGDWGQRKLLQLRTQGSGLFFVILTKFSPDEIYTWLKKIPVNSLQIEENTEYQ